LARSTEDRADILSVALQDEEGAEGNAEIQREYGAFPRWMNVVAKQAPKAAWHYKDRTRFDLDCDGDDEFIMTGLSLKEEGDLGVYSATYHVALSESSPVGIPTVKLFDFDVGASQLCAISPDIGFIEGETLQAQEGEEILACGAKLVLKSKNCQDQVIYWSGKHYGLEKPVQILQKEENKKETQKK
jgi:hypothetical protein